MVGEEIEEIETVFIEDEEEEVTEKLDSLWIKILLIGGLVLLIIIVLFFLYRVLRNRNKE